MPSVPVTMALFVIWLPVPVAWMPIAPAIDPLFWLMTLLPALVSRMPDVMPRTPSPSLVIWLTPVAAVMAAPRPQSSPPPGTL